MQDSQCNCCNPIEPSENKPSSEAKSSDICPNCGHQGKKVDGATVKSMLSVSLRQVRDITYFFCRQAECPIVYFSNDALQTFTINGIRERVFQKEPDDDSVLICYCFQYSRQTIQLEWIKTGKSTVIDEINAGIKAGQCACDWRNPQGSCCLGNVRAFVTDMQKSMNANPIDNN